VSILESDELRVQAGTELMDFVKAYAKKHVALFKDGVLTIHITPNSPLGVELTYEEQIEVKTDSKLR